ncbi:6-bladed beta-propeller [Parabacteroides pacaensis]|uniref:6-bladed beta-propeller n=1 Tax=Parabacteroides pacaensis TaxID=2086575 RepID=UPI000D0EF094|nr:6-bladed beta-propeller [Parabacteroides pacaensis]
MKRVFIICIEILFALSCQAVQREKNSSLLTITIDKMDDILNLSTIVDSIQYIPLSNDFLIRDIDMLQVDDNGNLYIRDSEKNGIYKFDKNGQFITQISRKGQGPGEYSRIYDFDIVDNKIVINDSKFLYFDLDGKFFDALSKPTTGTFFRICKDTICIGSGRFLSVCINDKMTDYNFDTSKDYFDYIHSSHFAKNGDEIYWEDCYNDTIYQVTQGRPVPFLYVDFKDLKLPKDIPIDNSIFDNPRVKHYCTDINKFKISDDYISFRYDIDKIIWTCIYNRHTLETYAYNSLQNDIDPVLVLFSPRAIKGKKMYFVTDGPFMYNTYVWLKSSEAKENQALADKMVKILGRTPTEEDNPTITIITGK